MATTANIKTAATVEYEVSAGAQGTVLPNTAKDFTVGLSGSIVQMLTLVRQSTGKVTVKAVDGNLAVSVDGAKDKTVKKGSSLSLSDKNKRAVIREAVK